MSILRTTERIFPIHPGEILREEFMAPLNLSSEELAESLRVPPSEVSEIVEQRHGFSAEFALRLGRYFDTDAEYWMNMQQQYELSVAERAAASSLAAVRKRSA